jgi:hypothetical protein
MLHDVTDNSNFYACLQVQQYATQYVVCVSFENFLINLICNYMIPGALFMACFLVNYPYVCRTEWKMKQN